MAVILLISNFETSYLSQRLASIHAFCVCRVYYVYMYVYMYMLPKTLHGGWVDKGYSRWCITFILAPKTNYPLHFLFLFFVCFSPLISMQSKEGSCEGHSLLSFSIGPTWKVHFAGPPYSWGYKSCNRSAWLSMWHSSGIELWELGNLSVGRLML